MRRSPVIPEQRRVTNSVGYKVAAADPNEKKRVMTEFVRHL